MPAKMSALALEVPTSKLSGGTSSSNASANSDTLPVTTNRRNSRGTSLRIVRGTIAKIDPQGCVDAKRHYGGMHWADPHPFTYPTIDVAPADGKIVIEIANPVKK